MSPSCRLPQRLILNIGLKMPALNVIQGDREDVENGSVLFFSEPAGKFEISEDKWGIPFVYSLLKYNSFGLDIGLKWHYDFFFTSKKVIQYNVLILCKLISFCFYRPMRGVESKRMILRNQLQDYRGGVFYLT